MSSHLCICELGQQSYASAYSTAVLLALRLAGPALRFLGLAALTSTLLFWKHKTLPFAYPKLVSFHSRVVSRGYWLPHVVVYYLLFPGVS